MGNLGDKLENALKVKEGADIKTVISCHLVNDIKTEVVDVLKTDLRTRN